MTPPHQPPPQPPEDDGERQDNQPPPGYLPPQNPFHPPPGPPGYPPPGYSGGAQGQPGYPYQQPPRREPKISVGTTFAGILVYVVINFVVGVLAFMIGGATGSSGPNGIFIVAAVLLVLIAFGGGASLLKNGSPSAKGIGLGLMIGWALTSLLTAGFCTGLNPAMYTS